MNDVARSPPVAAASALGSYRRLLGYVRRHAGAFSLGIAGGVLYSLCSAALAWFAKQFGDKGFTAHPDPRIIYWIPAGLLALFVLRSLGDFTQTYFMGLVSRRMVRELRQELFDRALTLPIAVFDRTSAAALLSKLTYNAELVGQSSTDSVVILVSTSLTIVWLVGELLWFNWRLALLALCLGPIVGWVVTQVNRRFRRYSRRIQDSMGDVTRVAKEGLEAPRLIKVHNAERHLARQFHSVNEHNRRSNMRLILTKGLSNPIIQIITALGAAFVLSYAIAEMVHGQMTTGDLFGFIVALGMIPTPLKQLVGVSSQVQQGIAAAQSLFEVIDSPSEPPGGGYRVGRARGNVDFDHVSFGYSSGRQAALREVSLKAAPGERIAIVGRSGSGKSTLVSLLPRFFDPSSGAVLLDGVDVREYRLAALRRQVAMVLQPPLVFPISVRDNIAYGRPEASDDEIETAARLARAHDFVTRLPDGYATMLGEAAALSEGEKQRLTIARAILREAPILILDEPTSSLDVETEALVMEGIARLMRGRTTLVIAHRLSTVRSADLVVVLKDGEIVERGAFSDLVRQGGVFAELYNTQFAEPMRQ